MTKNMKTRKGEDGFNYPYTSPDIVIDENGISATKKFDEINTQLGDIKTDLQNVVIYNPDDTNEDFITADNIAFSDSNFTATNVKGAISELFQSASNGKQLIANAITGKGIPTNKNDSFQTMATNIGNIQNGGGDSNIESGTITPSENLDTITFGTSKKCSNIIIYKTSSTLTPSGVRQIALYVCINNSIQRCIATNGSGTTWAANYLSDSNPTSSTPRTVFNDTSIVVYSYATLGGSGYYAKGEEYTWIAW